MANYGEQGKALFLAAQKNTPAKRLGTVEEVSRVTQSADYTYSQTVDEIDPLIIHKVVDDGQKSRFVLPNSKSNGTASDVLFTFGESKQKTPFLGNLLLRKGSTTVSNIH